MRTSVCLFLLFQAQWESRQGVSMKDRGGTWVSKSPPGCSVRPDLEPVGGGDGQRCRPDPKQGVVWWGRVTEGDRRAQVSCNIRE